MKKEDKHLKKYNQQPVFIYTYSCTPEELSLCHMEMRSLFGMETTAPILKSSIEVEPSRSPFIKERIDVMYEGDTIAEIVEQVQKIQLKQETFRVNFVKINDLEKSEKVNFEQRREIERSIGLQIQGEPDLDHPDVIYGIVTLGGKWYFGTYHKSESVWFHHLKKPAEYSTALSTRVARAIVNIAVPNPNDIRAIDPCCGIGTVIVEALSMGINMVGRDINPLAAKGTRENIAHFGYEGDVKTGPISEVTNNYDVAIIDMPYNIVTYVTREEQLAMLQHARRFAKKLVVVTIETIDDLISEAGFDITDRCEVRKTAFSRQVVVCE